MDMPPKNEPLRKFFVSPTGRDSNPGTQDAPWETPEYAASQARAGDVIQLRGGTYRLTGPVQPLMSGAENAPIVFTSAPGETATLDADAMPLKMYDRPRPYLREQGAFLLEQVSHIRIEGLEIVHSHWSGISVVNSQHIEIIGNHIDNTFAPGIGIWDTTRSGICHHQRVIGNTLTRTNRLQMYAGPGDFPHGEAAHECISLGGAHHFEVAWNHVHHCDKEGIDIKETSQHGIVHHNYVHHIDRQALYADAWFGILQDVEFCHNVAHDCGGTGVAVSVEDVELARDLRIHHNLLYNNAGSGIYFSRWGKDGPRIGMEVHHNTVHHNGWGKPNRFTDFYYATGGLHLFTTNVQDLHAHHNIFSDNCAFQIGYSHDYLRGVQNIETAFNRHKVRIERNLVHAPRPDPGRVHVGWPGRFDDVIPTTGSSPIRTEPLFTDPQAGIFTLRAAPAESLPGEYFGAFEPGIVRKNNP